MAINTLDQLIATAKRKVTFAKVSATSKAVGSLHSLWLVAGNAGTTPAAGVGSAPNYGTVGALNYNISGAAGGKYFPSSLSLTGTTAGLVTLYERLWHTSGLSGTVTTAQAVNTTALVDASNVELYLEWYTATGSTAVNVAVSYTNQAGVAGRTSISTQIVASPVAGMMLRIPLMAGDTGVKSVQSVTLSASTGTVGNFGVTLARRVAGIPVPLVNAGLSFDTFQLGGLSATFSDSSCLALMVQCTATNTGIIQGLIELADW